MFYYLSIGTNLAADKNAVAIVKSLIKAFGRIYLYPFIRTQPENMHTSNEFYNSVVLISTTHDNISLKKKLNNIEVSLGRNRDDPNRSIKDRPADIDILKSHNAPLSSSAPISAEESYVQTVLACSGDMVDLSDYGLPFTNRPASIDLDAGTGNIIIIDDTVDSFINWQKAALTRN